MAIDETSYRRGHNYITLAADAEERKVVFVAEGRDAQTLTGLARHLSQGFSWLGFTAPCSCDSGVCSALGFAASCSCDCEACSGEW